MKWFNSSEIDMYVFQHKSHPVLSKATRFLQRFRDLINSMSDGWCYWNPPVKAAQRLMELIESGRTAPLNGEYLSQNNITEAMLKKALTPITRSSLACSPNY